MAGTTGHSASNETVAEETVAEEAIQWRDPSTWLVLFCFSDTFKFAFRVAISLTLAFLIPMAMGWSQPSTAATTVMLIATTGSRRESLAKGTLRVLGTIAGGIIGLCLVGAFAQDRMFYMLSVSIAITIVFYLRSAYQKDPTLFMLTGVMIMMMYNGGDAEGAFLYGVERTFMTIFGVVVYTLVGVFLFPPRVEQNLHKLAGELVASQQALFEHISQPVSDQVQIPVGEDSPEALLPVEPSDAGEGSQAEVEQASVTVADLSKAVYAAQQALEGRYQTLSAECSEISAYKKEWDGTIALFSQITNLLMFAAKDHSRAGGHPAEFIQDYAGIRDELIALFEALPDAWHSREAFPPEAIPQLVVDKQKLEGESHLYRGEAISSCYLFGALRERLVQVQSCISSINSLTGKVGFSLPLLAEKPAFIWWDAENAKTAIKVFVIYWATGLFWIYANPPGGYNFVIFGTIFVSILSFMPMHPAALFVLFTLGFVVSVPAYVFLLPELTLGAELGAFIFAYTFVAFYALKGPVTIFFLLGLFTMGIDNSMVYHFGITLTIVSLFYLVVGVVVVAHFFPFSSKAEHLVMVMRERFFRHVSAIVWLVQQPELNGWQRLSMRWHVTVAKTALAKLTLWSSKVNGDLFPGATPSELGEYASQCDLVFHHLLTLQQAESKLEVSPLVHTARQQHRDKVIPFLVEYLAGDPKVSHLVPADVQHDYQELEARLDQFFTEQEWQKNTNSDIAYFYIFLNLKKNLFESLLACYRANEKVAWDVLTHKRF